jgi:hypothetical protein
VNGFVEDSVTKETLVGATAKLKGTKYGAYTNKSGYFSIGSIPPGTYTLTVSAVGYQARELSLTIVSGKPQKLRIALTPSVAKGDEVITSPLTFVATAATAIAEGATVHIGAAVVLNESDAQRVDALIRKKYSIGHRMLGVMSVLKKIAGKGSTAGDAAIKVTLS